MKSRDSNKKAYGAILAMALVASCGDKDDDTNADDGTSISSLSGTINLSALPDAEGMVSANASSLRLAPTGDIPKISELADNYDQYFFDGAIKKVLDENAAISDSIRESLDRGESVCQNVGSVAQTFGEMRSGSLCYMKQVPSLSSETITLKKPSSSVTAENMKDTLFAKEEADKLVKVEVKAVYEGQSMQQDIFIKVIGSKTAGQKYQYEMYSCMEGQVHDSESATLDFDSGKFTLKLKGNYEEEGNSDSREATIEAFVKRDGDSLGWDLSKDRTISETFNHSSEEWGGHYGSAKYILDGDNYVTSFMSSSSTFTDPSTGEEGSGTMKLWSKASFSGSKVLELKVGGLAIKSENSHSFGGEQLESYSVTGAVEWQNTSYKGTKDSDLFTQASNFSFKSDDIYSKNPSELTVDLSSYKCSANADVIVAFDMTTPEAQKVEASCGGSDEEWSTLDKLYSSCFGDKVQSARQKIWDSEQSAN